LSSICFIEDVPDFLLDFFPYRVSSLVYVLDFNGLFNNIDYFASSDCSLSSDAFNSEAKERSHPFISVVIDALDFNIPAFELKNLSAVLDLDFEVALIREFGWWDFMGFQREDHSLLDEFRDFVFG
jgi:hypothetical protein